MLKIRRPLGRLIFNMGIAIPGKTVFLIETAPWRRRHRFTKVSLRHRPHLWEWYPAARRCRVMVHTDRRSVVRRSSCSLNLGLNRNLLAHIILKKYRFSRCVEILWRWPRGLWLGDPVYHICFEILLTAPCMTTVIWPTYSCVYECIHQRKKVME